MSEGEPKRCSRCRSVRWNEKDSPVSRDDTQGVGDKGGETFKPSLAPTVDGLVGSSQAKQPSTVRSDLPFPSHKRCSVYGCMQCKANEAVVKP